MIDRGSLPYRPCAGIMLVNRDRHVFVGQRIDNVVEAWQMPQGGIDDGEDAETAAVRELQEETGIAPHLAKIEARSRTEHYYDLPDELIGRIWRGKWRGQRQIWFLARFVGEDADVNIATPHQEFRAWKWVQPKLLPELIVPFKKQLYENVLAEFEPLL